MSLRDAVLRAGTPLRSAHTLRQALPGAVLAVVGFGLAAWMIRLGIGGAPLWVLGAWVLLAVGAGLAVWGGRRSRRTLDVAALARRIEDRGMWRRGALTTVLDSPATTTSASLHEAAATARADEVSGRGEAALAGDLSAERILIARLAACVGVGVLMLVLAKPADGAAAMLWKPWHAWSALTAPVQLVPKSLTVARGESAQLEVIAFGHRHATLLLRAPGEAWREQRVELGDSGRAVVTTAPLEAELVARATAGGRSSEEIHIAIRLPSFLGAFDVTAHYPTYLGLASEPLPVDGDTLLLPEGTRLAVSGRTTTPLTQAAMAGPAGSSDLTVTGNDFAGSFTPPTDGDWQLQLSLADGGALSDVLPTLVIRVVRDSVPSVDIPVPGMDTIAPPSRRLPLVIAMQDDHGIRSASLELRRNRSPAPVRLPIALSSSSDDRALISLSLDLDSLGLQPGDTLRYAALAIDNAPRAGVGRSREYMVIVPTEADLRDARDAATAATGTSLDSLVAAARRAQTEAQNLASERQRATERQGEAQTLTADAARRAEQTAQAQEDVERQVDAAREQLEELERAAELEGRADSSLAAQLSEIRKLLDQAITPELRQALDSLRSAMRDLDADRTRMAMRDMAQEQARMRETLERAKELFERAARETALATLAQEAKELADLQRQLAEKIAGDSAAAAAQQEDALAERTDSLAEALGDAAKEMPAQSTQEGLRDASERTREAAQQMRDAANAARRGQRSQAKQSAEAAGEALRQGEQQIEEEREEMAEAMKAEVMAALDRLLAETTRLLSRQHVTAEAIRRGVLAGTLRAEESMLEEATAKLLQQVIAVAAKHALISPRISTSLALARNNMRAAIDATSTGAPNLALAAERAGEAVDALAVAAYAMLRSKDDVSGAESGSGVSEAMQQMEQMAGQQGELNDQGQGMIRQGEAGMQDMMMLAMRQRAVAQQLERMRAAGQLPGAGELAQEAMDIARNLEQGRLSPETLQRQERLFRRMLDAGRSLQGEEEDEQKERESHTARDADGRLPPALDPRLRRSPGDIPLPGWDELQRLSPDDRRRVLDYFRRLAEGPTR